MSLLAPLYLAALAALALPWLLHRFSDARPERRPFPSTRFLEATPPPVSRRRKLRYRVLFALRALALVALALLFAEPWIERPEALGDARERHVVAIDTSLSMRAGERRERALDAAREALAAVPPGDTVQLVAFDDDVVLVGEEPLTVEAARAALERGADTAFAPGFAAADYGRVMQRLDRLADDSELPLVATLITDLQRSALPERRNALYAPRLAAFDIVDVGEDEANVALSAEATSADGAQASVQVTLVASASGAADDPAYAREVLLSHDGRTLARESVRLAPGERERVVFDAVTLPETLEPRFDVAFARPDALVEDDAVTVPIALDGGRRVALSALGERAPDAARVFVTTALEADGAASVDASALATGQLPDDTRRLVVFAALGDGQSLPPELERHVARGGAALVVDAGRRESDAAAPDGESGSSIAASVRGHAVGRVDESHPLALGRIDWGDTRFFAPGDVVVGERDTVLLETAERRPVLIERASENGLLLILNERLDGGDSNLPFQPAFVALMARIVDWFDAGRAVPERATVGQSIALPVNVQVIDPDERPLVPFADTASAGAITLERPGLHTVVGAHGEQTLAVGIDPRESDLAALDEQTLAGWLGRHAADGEGGPDAAAGTDDVAAPSVTSDERDAVRRLPLWPFILPLLAVLLLAETLYANRRLDVRRDGT